MPVADDAIDLTRKLVAMLEPFSGVE